VKTENHPDRGLTTTTYDKASNVIAINTPGTQAFGGSITMVYDYNRLSKKRMPNSLGTDLYDVDYTYGSFNDGRNGAGRIVILPEFQTKGLVKFQLSNPCYHEHVFPPVVVTPS
jgi:YD repeat-containing protein